MIVRGQTFIHGLVKDKDKMGYALEKWRKMHENDYGAALKMQCLCYLNLRKELRGIVADREEQRLWSAAVFALECAEVSGCTPHAPEKRAHTVIKGPRNDMNALAFIDQ